MIADVDRSVVGIEIDPIRMRAFAASLQGELVLPGDQHYDETRAIWNARANNRPVAIVRAASTADVQAAVRFAIEHTLVPSVRSGGHGVTGGAVAHNGLMIDLSGMKAISVDVEAGIAHAEPGLTWGEYDDAVAPLGFVTPSGKLSTPGLGGVTTGGGIGWLARKHGMTIDHLVAAEVVLASGDVVTASEAEHSDLFWGLRGGRGNFGIVTKFSLRLTPLPAFYGGLIAFPLSAAAEALRFHREFIATVPNELTTVAAFITHPEGGKIVGIAAAYAGPAADAERALAPLTAFGSPLMVQFGEMPYGAMLRIFDASAPAGKNRVWRSSYIPELGDELIDQLVAGFAEGASPHHAMLIEHYGGAMARVPAEATAFPHRDKELMLLIDAGWEPTESGEAHISWLQRLWSSVTSHLEPETYIGFLDESDPDRIRAAYGAAHIDRLAAIKRVYDPNNFFSLGYSVADL